MEKASPCRLGTNSGCSPSLAGLPRSARGPILMGREVVMTIKPGFYWNRKTWEILTVDGKSPGANVDSCVRVPTFLALLLAPILGGAFVIF